MRLSAKEIEAAKTQRGGWTRNQLAEWGVPWPPPKGWKKNLIAGGPSPFVSSVASLREALATMDAEIATCPVQMTWMSNKPCPECGAERDQMCSKILLARYAFIEAARAIAKDQG